MHRRVTGRLLEGYRSVREGYRSVREGYRSVREGYRSSHNCSEVEIPTYGRDLAGYLEVGRLQLEARLGLQIMLRLLAYSTPSHCPPPRAHQNATGDKFSAPAACSLVHRDGLLKPTGIPLPHHKIVHINERVIRHRGNGPLNPLCHQTCSKPQRQS